MTGWQDEREMVRKAGVELVQKGFVIGSAGNISIRLTGEGVPGLMAITPTSRHYDSLTIDDIPIVDFDGSIVEGRLTPSSEIKLHIAVYRAREDVSAIVHTHSMYASAVSISCSEIPAVLEEEIMLLGGAVKVAGYAPTGTFELADNAVIALGDKKVVILANHGAVAVGKTIREALDMCAVLEKAAGVYLLASAAGKVNQLPSGAVAAARDIFLRNNTP